MGFAARFPRIAAWIVVLALIGVTTFCALQGLRALEPSAPSRLEHAHGVITAIRGSDLFGMRIAGRAGIAWFHVAPGAHISLAHLRRHLHERASTDVYYQDGQHGPLLAWVAD